MAVCPAAIVCLKSKVCKRIPAAGACFQRVVCGVGGLGGSEPASVTSDLGCRPHVHMGSLHAQRLLGCPSPLPSFLQQSINQTVQTLRETGNVSKYEHIMEKIAGRLGPAYTADRCGAAAGGGGRKTNLGHFKSTQTAQHRWLWKHGGSLCSHLSSSSGI